MFGDIWIVTPVSTTAKSKGGDFLFDHVCLIAESEKQFCIKFPIQFFYDNAF
jgi:hypothetical protein